MNYRGVGIIIWQGKAYIPSLAETKSGILVQVDPVYIADLDHGELLAAIEKSLASDHPRFPELSQEEWRKRKDPLLAATGAKSWKELARKGASYGIEWVKEGLRLDFSRVDRKGRWEIDPDRVQIFPANTPLETIVDLILCDAHAQEGLMKPEGNS